MAHQTPSLKQLALDHGTDKIGYHNYIEVYERFFEPLRSEKIKLLEIGIGGYDDPFAGGESLKMWKEFFPSGEIAGIDIHEKRSLEENRISVFKGSQTDAPFLEKCTRNFGTPDIIIDDGSHINSHIIKSFKILFPLLNPGGFYAIEDLQTSYWPEYGGDSYNLRHHNSAMNFFKALADNVNSIEIRNPHFQEYNRFCDIFGIHFFHNLVILEKSLHSPRNTQSGHTQSTLKHKLLTSMANRFPGLYRTLRVGQNVFRQSK